MIVQEGDILLSAFMLTILFALFTIYYNLFARKDKVFERFPYEFSLKLFFRKDDNLLHFLLKTYESLHFKTGNKTFSAPFPFMPNMIFINDPVAIEHVLKTNFEKYQKGPLFKSRLTEFLGNGIFNSDGDVWRNHRKTSVKLFNLNIFRGAVMHFFNLHLDKVLNILNNKSISGSSFDFQELMYKYTMDSIAQIAFGYDIGTLDATCNSTPFAEDFDFVQKQCSESFIDPFWYIKRHLIPWDRRFHERRINELAMKVIMERRYTGKLASTKIDDSKITLRDGNEYHKYDLISLYLNQEDSSDIGDSELRDIIVNFLLAGRDTTAQALSWSMYRLCLHPDIQMKIREEINAVLVSHAVDRRPLDKRGWPSYECVERLKYLEAFCFEVLRLHPSVAKEAKSAVVDDVLPDGTIVKKGDLINFCPWVMGRTERFWQNCNEFRPERFLNKPKPSPFLFTAFLAGPRTCLGQNLALLEMKCCVARLITQFDFKLEEDPSKITYQNSLTHPILGGLKVSVAKHESMFTKA